VAVVDKKALLNYMEGNDEGCAQIDMHMPNMPSMSTKRPIEEQEELQRKLQKVDQAQGIRRTSSDNPGRMDNRSNIFTGEAQILSQSSNGLRPTSSLACTDGEVVHREFQWTSGMSFSSPRTS